MPPRFSVFLRSRREAFFLNWEYWRAQFLGRICDWCNCEWCSNSARCANTTNTINKDAIKTWNWIAIPQRARRYILGGFLYPHMIYLIQYRLEVILWICKQRFQAVFYVILEQIGANTPSESVSPAAWSVCSDYHTQEITAPSRGRPHQLQNRIPKHIVNADFPSRFSKELCPERGMKSASQIWWLLQEVGNAWHLDSTILSPIFLFQKIPMTVSYYADLSWWSRTHVQERHFVWAGNQF